MTARESVPSVFATLPMPKDKPIFSRIVQVTEEAHLSLRELADLCEFPRTSMYRWRSASPSVEMLQRVALVLDLDLHWVLTGEGKRYRGDNRPDPYPNRVRTMAAARALGLPAGALAVLRSIDPGEDKSPIWWLDQIPRSKLVSINLDDIAAEDLGGTVDLPAATEPIPAPAPAAHTVRPPKRPTAAATKPATAAKKKRPSAPSPKRGRSKKAHGSKRTPHR